MAAVQCTGNKIIGISGLNKARQPAGGGVEYFIMSRPVRVSVSVQPVLHLLGYELQLATVSKKALPDVTHSLLELTLGLLDKNASSRRNRFFSFTETKSDFSLILDSVLIKALRGSHGISSIEIAEEKWRPLVVELGAYGSLNGISKIAASVIGPLADQCVSVFCLSTNQEDYVMVKDADLSRALQCLSNRFKLICDSGDEKDCSLVESMASSRPRLGAAELRGDSCSSTRPIVHPFTCSDQIYHVCSVLPHSLPSITLPLLEAMFYRTPSNQQPFFSISIIEEDISLVLDSQDLLRFPSDVVYGGDTCWKVISIGNGPLGFDECGIVAQMSAPLAQSEISTYYISTYYTDNTLVPQDSVNKALSALNQHILLTPPDASLPPTPPPHYQLLTNHPSSHQ